MNFLAHAYLSGSNPAVLVGNFIGDFVKGRQALSNFESGIVKGIELHRIIDEFTDKHSVVSESKNRLRPTYRHYAGVIVDVFYDHFLARYWSQYHPDSLTYFADNVYHTIENYEAILPTGFQHMFSYMQTGNWLVNYATLRGIERTLTGMSQRTPYVSKMDEAINNLNADYDSFRHEFERFFPVLTETCNTWLLAQGYNPITSLQA